ncbi:MAG TPA: hypothetical protein VHS53_09885 [Mucilaginibacter sp.]|nr:hypothetical protein [Mucilaginibacter sp.]
MRTIISLASTKICTICGEPFLYKRRRSAVLKAVSHIADIRKYYCHNCKITYYVYLGTNLKMPSAMRPKN